MAQAQHKGCCCEACLNAPRLVRRANGGGNYARWLTCATEELQDLSAPETRAQVSVHVPTLLFKQYDRADGAIQLLCSPFSRTLSYPECRRSDEN